MDKLHQSLFSLFFPRSNPFYEPRTSSPVQQDAGGPSPDVASSQKRRAPPPPGTSPGLGPSLPPHKPTSGPDGERAQPVGPSPVAAMIGRELASSSPKVRSPCWNVKNLIYPHVMHVKNTERNALWLCLQRIITFYCEKYTF